MDVVLKPATTRGSFRTAYARNWSTHEAVATCIRSIGPHQPQLLIVFCGGKHDPNVLLHGFRDAYPTAPIVGGSAAGVVSRLEASYSGLEVGVLAIFDPGASPRIIAAEDLDRGEHAAGVSMGLNIAGTASDHAPILLFYDSVAACNPPQLHPAALLLSGIQAGLGSKKVCIFGGGLLTDLNLNDGWVFDGYKVRKHTAVALVFPPTMQVDTTIVHGCRPASIFMEITRIEGAEIFELDGLPALEVIEATTGLTIGGPSGRNLSLLATIGEKLGDQFEPFSEDLYVNRLILNADRERGSVTIFEPDFSVGSRVQIMARDNALMLQSTRHGVKAANKALAVDRDRVAFTMYINCAGRVSARSGTPEEEADIVRNGLSRSIPFMGFYSGVEIAPFAGCSRALDWTGVLATMRYAG